MNAWTTTPILVTGAAFVAPIRMVPETRVEWIPALIGGTFSAVLIACSVVMISSHRSSGASRWTMTTALPQSDPQFVRDALETLEDVGNLVESPEQV